MGKKQQNKADASKAPKAQTQTTAPDQPEAKQDAGPAPEAEAKQGQSQPAAAVPKDGSSKPPAKAPKYRARWTIGMDRRTYAPGATIERIPESQAKRLLAAGAIEQITDE